MLENLVGAGLRSGTGPRVEREHGREDRDAPTLNGASRTTPATASDYVNRVRWTRFTTR